MNKEIIKFGSYYLSNNDIKDPIEWLVLEKKGNRLFIVSKNIILFKPFNEKLQAITWEESSIRKWLNDDFLQEAFTDDEFNKIQTTRVKTSDDWNSNSNGGNATNDKIFLLSKEEILNYFELPTERLCKSLNQDEYSPWWLRNMGSGQFSTSHITSEGEFFSQNAKRDNYGIRCAMWIDLNATKDEFVMPQKKYLDFGSYYQKDDLTKEKILWRILDETDDKILVVSEKGLDCLPYYNGENVSWDESFLKHWLNHTFLQCAFNEEETLKICGEISILSANEAIKYFEDRKDRKCESTDYAVSNGAFKSSDNSSFYWLKDQGLGSCKMMVNGDGSINKNGIVGSYSNVIRPILWIKK